MRQEFSRHLSLTIMGSFYKSNEWIIQIIRLVFHKTNFYACAMKRNLKVFTVITGDLVSSRDADREKLSHKIPLEIIYPHLFRFAIVRRK